MLFLFRYAIIILCTGDGTHHKKQRVSGETHPSQKKCTFLKRVRTIPKSVLIIDDENQIIGSTYPKRARGLVRHGRAEYLSNEKIRLLSIPPQKGVLSVMNTKEKLLAEIDKMSEAQMQSLLTLLSTFSTNPPEVAISIDPVRSGMMQTLEDQIHKLDYTNPNTENILKELKDMLNMLLRV